MLEHRDKAQVKGSGVMEKKAVALPVSRCVIARIVDSLEIYPYYSVSLVFEPGQLRCDYTNIPEEIA